MNMLYEELFWFFVGQSKSSYRSINKHHRGTPALEFTFDAQLHYGHDGGQSGCHYSLKRTRRIVAILLDGRTGTHLRSLVTQDA